jgi:hypothetical protein
MFPKDVDQAVGAEFLTVTAVFSSGDQTVAVDSQAVPGNEVESGFIVYRIR